MSIQYQPFFAFRSPKKLAFKRRKERNPTWDALRAPNEPKWIPKVQKAFGYSHIHDHDTWMMDILFVRRHLHRGEGYQSATDEERAMLDLYTAEADYKNLQTRPDEDPLRAAQVIRRYEEVEDDIVFAVGSDADQPPDEDVYGEEDLGPVPLTQEERKKDNKLLMLVVLLNCNSRKAHARIVAKRDREHVLQYLEAIIASHETIRTIISDWEPSFAAAIQDYNAIHPETPIRHIRHNLSDGSTFHTELAPIDRFCRTLRDMLYNIGKIFHGRVLTPELLREVLYQYNTMYHETLSKIMGFKLTPLQVHKNKNLQDEIIRRLSGRNYMAVDWSHRLGNVYVYNPRQTFEKRRGPYKHDEYEVVSAPPTKGRYLIRNKRTGALDGELRSHLVYPRT